jgi:hypothetical protein
MTIQEVIQDAWLIGKGKATALETTSAQYIKFLALGNMLQKKLIREPGVQWDWTYDRIDLGTITSDRVTLDDTIYAIHRDEKDPVVITTPNSTQETYWQYVTPGEFKRYRYPGTCTIIGQELIFSKTFTSTDTQYNGTVTVPAHIKPEDFTQTTDEVLIPDPEWLATMIAAESVRNSVTKQNQLGNLVGDANNLLEGMKERNSGSISQIELYPSVLGETFGGEGYTNPYRNSTGEPLGVE